MNRFERFDVPFVPSQIAQPDGGSVVTAPSAPRLNAKGGGSQAKTVPAGVSGAFALDVAMIIPSFPDLPGLQNSVPAQHFGRCDGCHRMVDCRVWPSLLRSPRSRAARSFRHAGHWSGMCEVAHTPPKSFRTNYPARPIKGQGIARWHQRKGLFACYVGKATSADRRETSLFGNGATKVTFIAALRSRLMSAITAMRTIPWTQESTRYLRMRSSANMTNDES
jgi:hypothetical protein